MQCNAACDTKHRPSVTPPHSLPLSLTPSLPSLCHAPAFAPSLPRSLAPPLPSLPSLPSQYTPDQNKRGRANGQFVTHASPYVTHFLSTPLLPPPPPSPHVGGGGGGGGKAWVGDVAGVLRGMCGDRYMVVNVNVGASEYESAWFGRHVVCSSASLPASTHMRTHTRSRAYAHTHTHTHTPQSHTLSLARSLSFSTTLSLSPSL